MDWKSEDESGDERVMWCWGRKKKIKINTEIAKLSQGDWLGRPATGYFQSQNYTEERLSSALLCQSQADSTAATISGTPTPTLEGNGVEILTLQVISRNVWSPQLFVGRKMWHQGCLLRLSSCVIASVPRCVTDTIHKAGARGSSAESFAYETRLLYPTVLYDNGTRNINHVKINPLIKSNVTTSSVSCWYLLVVAELNAEAAAPLNNKTRKYRAITMQIIEINMVGGRNHLVRKRHKT